MPSTGSNAINKDVAHKVGLGTEIGIGLRNKISSNITFKTGLQFNIRQYYIDAFQSPGLATIEIVKDNKLQSLSVQSKFSNGSGDVKTRLDNKLYQLSVPLGLEWDIASSKKWGLSLGASLQPTYSLNKNVFIISTDYKYYASGASFFRQWNINSSVNANLSFKYNKSTLYFGPQIRYQHLPTYNDQYPIKEYRLDYGIKFGIIKPIK